MAWAAGCARRQRHGMGKQSSSPRLNSPSLLVSLVLIKASQQYDDDSVTPAPRRAANTIASNNAAHNAWNSNCPNGPPLQYSTEFLRPLEEKTGWSSRQPHTRGGGVSSW